MRPRSEKGERSWYAKRQSWEDRRGNCLLREEVIGRESDAEYLQSLACADFSSVSASEKFREAPAKQISRVTLSAPPGSHTLI